MYGGTSAKLHAWPEDDSELRSPFSSVYFNGRRERPSGGAIQSRPALIDCLAVT